MASTSFFDGWFEYDGRLLYRVVGRVRLTPVSLILSVKK